MSRHSHSPPDSLHTVTTGKKHESIEFRLTTTEKRRIKSTMQNGELSDVCRALLLMYCDDSSLREQVRLYRKTQGWQEP